MKKTYRRSQMRKIIGSQVHGLDLHKYGLPYIGAIGSFHATRPELVDLMLAAVERHPELHIATRLNSGRIVNRYVEENAFVYRLHIGNADPDLEFFGWSQDDIPLEEHQKFLAIIEDFRNSEWDVTQQAAVNWMLNDLSVKSDKK